MERQGWGLAEEQICLSEMETLIGAEGEEPDEEGDGDDDSSDSMGDAEGDEQAKLEFQTNLERSLQDFWAQTVEITQVRDLSLIHI